MVKARIEKPLLIWTLQRTGGTNLSNYLNRNSVHPELKEEPFNGRREYGYLTQAWLKAKDEKALAAGMKEICALKNNIKHCVERVPWAVSDALLTSSIDAGYAHLFLYRQNPLGRILSMEYAERTRSWGPSKVLEEGKDAEAFVKPLDVEALIKHETGANEKLNKVWRKLRKLKANPMAISFEEIYAEDEESAIRSLTRITKWLNLPTEKGTTTKMVEAIRGKGNQGTSDRYSRFVGIPELEKQIPDLPKFLFLPGAKDTITQE